MDGKFQLFIYLFIIINQSYLVAVCIYCVYYLIHSHLLHNDSSFCIMTAHILCGYLQRVHQSGLFRLEEPIYIATDEPRYIHCRAHFI